MVTPQRGVVFDLDDTLYFEREYVRSGYEAVAAAVAPAAGVDQETLTSVMWGWFTAGLTTGTFDRLLGQFPEAASTWSVPELVHLYRTHEPHIALTSDVEALLEILSARGVFLGVVSDGHLVGQRAKARSLGLMEKFDAVVFTDRWGRADWKPSTRGFREIERICGLAGNALVYVGDNPKKDFFAPNELGWATVRLCCEGQLASAVGVGIPVAAARLTAHSYQELRTILIPLTDTCG